MIFTTTVKNKTYNCVYVTDFETAKEVINKLNSYPEGTLFSLDTETYPEALWSGISKAGLIPQYSKIRLLQLYTEGKAAVVFDLVKIGYSFLELPELHTFFKSYLFVAHYAVFDMKMLYNSGIPRFKCLCTMLMLKCIAHATYPNDAGVRYSLQAAAERLLDFELQKSAQVSDWSKHDLLFEQIEYSAQDTITVHLLFLALRPGLRKYNLQKYYSMVTSLQWPVVMMELNGISMDYDGHLRAIASWRQELYAHKKALQSILVVEGEKEDKVQITAHTMAAYLERTLDPVVLSLWPRTDDGKLQTDADAFVSFDELPVVKPFSSYQKLLKLTTSFGNNLAMLRNRVTNRIHPQFNLVGARTGRISCAHPNIQQMPKAKSFRSLFVAPPGYTFVIADYSQIEVRVAAELSQDPAMLQVYKEGKDIYNYIAAKLNNKSEAEVILHERQVGKILCLGLQFGLGVKKFSHYAKKGYGTDVSKEQAKELIANYFNLFPVYRKWQLNQAKMGESTCYATTMMGKLRRLDPENTYGTSMNQPVQGTAAEIMSMAAINIDNAILDKPIKFIMTVHDEFLLEVPIDLAEETSVILNDEMVKAYLQIFPNGVTTNLVKAMIGSTWGSGKD